MHSQYSFIDKITLIFYLLRTKFLFPKARIIRFPIDIRGRKFIRVSKGLTTGRYCRLEAYPEDNKTETIFFGENVQINDFVHITAMNKVIIGNNVLMASKIYISDCSHGIYSGGVSDSSPDTSPMSRKYEIKSVEIKDNVWIGETVSILPGVTIGTGAIIGANSVVTKNIPDYTIAVGIPAKVIKQYNFEKKKWEKV